MGTAGPQIGIKGWWRLRGVQPMEGRINCREKGIFKFHNWTSGGGGSAGECGGGKFEDPGSESGCEEEEL